MNHCTKLQITGKSERTNAKSNVENGLIYEKYLEIILVLDDKEQRNII